MAHTGEQAVAGVQVGLIGSGETVTWRAKHFGIVLTLTSRITAMDSPYHFRDEMINGPFKNLEHDHVFHKNDEGTVMEDIFRFASPGGVFGAIADKVVLRGYLAKVLARRNREIRTFAEGGGWKLILK